MGECGGRADGHGGVHAELVVFEVEVVFEALINNKLARVGRYAPRRNNISALPKPEDALLPVKYLSRAH